MRLLYLLRNNAASVEESRRCAARVPLRATCSEFSQMLSYLPGVIAILICGVGGAYFAWSVVDALGWTGVGGAIVTAILGMIAATLLWIVGVAVRKAMGPRKR